MNELNQAARSLKTCEKHLRAAISTAAVSAAPEALTSIISWLNAVQRILSELEPSVQIASIAPPATNAPLPSSAEREDAPARVGTKAAPSKPLSNSYPKFFRDGDTLVKIGWSKKVRKEYEHRASKAAVLALLNGLDNAGKNGRRFTMEDVLPLRNSHDGSAVPDYQSYLALAWLRDIQLVTQHGRQGYTNTKRSISAEEVERHWNALESR